MCYASVACADSPAHLRSKNNVKALKLYIPHHHQAEAFAYELSFFAFDKLQYLGKASKFKKNIIGIFQLGWVAVGHWVGPPRDH